jgi:hypothetical protein
MMKYLLIFTTFFCTILSVPSFAFEAKGKKKYEYTLAITAIFRDDAPYLKEWIEFHRLVGVQHFYMINNLSVDHYLEILQPYIDEGLVDLIDWPYEHSIITAWNHIQCSAYEQIIKMVRGQVKWLAIIDTDEFIFPVEKDNLVDLLSKYEKYGGLSVNWQTFGTSLVSKIPDNKLLIEMLVLGLSETAEINKHVKSIVRPEYVIGCDNPHYVLYKKGYYQVNSDRVKFTGPFSPYIQVDAIRINHYTVRDEYFLHTVKLPRLAKWGVDVKAFEEGYNDFNQVQYDTILRFVPLLKEMMDKK